MNGTMLSFSHGFPMGMGSNRANLFSISRQDSGQYKFSLERISYLLVDIAFEWYESTSSVLDADGAFTIYQPAQCTLSLSYIYCKICMPMCPRIVQNLNWKHEWKTGNKKNEQYWKIARHLKMWDMNTGRRIEAKRRKKCAPCIYMCHKNRLW